MSHFSSGGRRVPPVTYSAPVTQPSHHPPPIPANYYHGAPGTSGLGQGPPTYLTHSAAQQMVAPTSFPTGPPPFHPSIVGGLPLAPRETGENGDEPPPPGSMSPNRSPEPEQPQREAPLPEDLMQRMTAQMCYLCMAPFTSELQARLHYDSGPHRRKMRAFMTDYCRLKGLPLPDIFRPQPEKPEDKKNEEQQPRRADAYCKICNQSFPSSLHARQHYLGRNHSRRLDGKPALKPGYFNKLTGKWQRKPPSENDMQPKQGWWNSQPAGPSSADDDVIITNGGGEHGSRRRRRHPLSSLDTGMDDVIIIPGDSNPSRAGRSRRTRYFCTLCSITCNDEEQMSAHLRGAKHFRALRKEGVCSWKPAPGQSLLDAVEEAESPQFLKSIERSKQVDFSAYRTPAGKYYCQMCDSTISSTADFLDHCATEKHVKIALRCETKQKQHEFSATCSLSVGSDSCFS